MRRLHRGITIGAAVAALVMSALVGSAATAQEAPEAAAGENAPDTPRRHGPSEVTGPAASINAMRSGKLSCGQVITKSTTLTADLGPCSGNGIIIGADNITLNLNGHTISGTPGPGDGNAAGVRLPMRSGVLVTGQPGNSGKTGTITGFDAGVVVNGGSANTVENLTVRDNIGPNDSTATLGDGIVLFSSADNTIRNNTVDHNGLYDGIGVLGSGSHRNTVAANTITRSVSGTDLGTGVGVVLSGVIDEATGDMIHGNKVVDNLIQANAGAGSSNVNVQDGLIARNTIEDNGHVMRPGNGIGLRTGVNPDSRIGHNVVQNNAIRRNGGKGIENIFHSNENQFLGNTIEGNGGGSDALAGILIDPEGSGPSAGGGHLVSGNTVRQNDRFGIRLQGDPGERPDNNRIENNIVTDHPVVGIFFTYHDSGTNYIVSNYAVNNSGFADLLDGGTLFNGVPDCDNTVWADNTYEVALPECAANGTQVSVP